MAAFVIQSRPDAQGVRTFFGMDADPRRAPYSGTLRDEFLTKVGTDRERNVVATCYDVNHAALLAAGATVIGHGTVGFSTLPGDHAPGAWPWVDWMKEFIQPYRFAIRHDTFAVRDRREDQRPLTNEERKLWKEEGLSEEFCSQCGANTLHVHLVCTACGT